MFVAVQNDNPIPRGVSADYLTIVGAAEEWANYSKRRVHVLEIQGCFIDLKLIVLPKGE